MKKIIKFILATIFLFALLTSFGCKQNEPLVIKESDTYIVIKVSDSKMDITANTTLYDYMTKLKSDNLLEFESKNGMITGINGIQNPADWSSCWMLYTDDEEFSDTTYSIDYNGKIYGSSLFGAETLTVKDGCVYIWVYQSF